MKRLIQTLTVGYFLLIADAALANIQYVTDMLYVPMRSGAGNEYRIIHSTIRSGTQMTILDSPEGSDWAKVRTPSGLEGYIRKQYLKTTPTARMRLSAAVEELASAKEKLAAAQKQLNTLTKEHTLLSKQSKLTQESHGKLSEELNNLKTLSADAIGLSHRYQELLANHEVLKTDYDSAIAENDRLKSDKTVNQWLFGAGLMVLGMFLMLILPALKPAKRSSEWAN